MSLYDALLLDAPYGVAERDCPGAFKAITARRVNGAARVWFVGKNDHPAIVAMHKANAQAYALG